MSFSETTGAALAELPVHLTPFVGRDRELLELLVLIDSIRLLTLTGAGGSGKTRLAGELAARCAQKFTRVAWVDLAPLTDADLLAEQVGAALHAPERADASAPRMLIDAVGNEPVLLVLDNCEHLVAACAALAEALLRGCPRLTVLATSREALGIASETAWHVPSRAESEAMQLFLDRARSALPSFSITEQNGPAVREICRRLDGIPLAIELAAARVRVLPAEQIAARLDDAFRLLSSGSRTALPRHRTLRATMDWSFGLLTPREQALLRRLSVFAGSFTLDAAEAVCAGGMLEVEDILDGVAALVDKSLVVIKTSGGQARYRLLETVRQYGLDRLSDAGEREATERHFAHHFLSIIEAAEPNLVGGANQPGLIPALRAEHDNIRAAARWAGSDASRQEIALRFAAALFWFWYAVGQFRENRQIVDRALSHAGPTNPALRGRALLSSGLTALAQGDYALSTDHLRTALVLLRDAGDDRNVGVAMAKLGAALLLSGDVDDAIRLLDEAIAFAQPRGAGFMGGVFARFWRGWGAYSLGDYDAAYEFFAPNLAMAREHNQPTTLAHTLSALARIEFARGNIEESCRLVTDGLELEVAIEDAWGVALALDVAALAAAHRHRFEDATRLAAGIEAHRERLAMALPGPAPAERDQLIARLRQELGDRFAAIYAEGRALPTPELVRMALAEAARHTAEFRVSLPAATVAPRSKSRRLRVTALGPLQVFVDDILIDAAAWGSARPRELLVYLLMHPEGRSKEQVGLAFWPEASAAQLRNSFHVTLHRLRRALGGAEWVTLEQERYRVDPTLVDELDVVVFEREVVAARASLKRGEPGAVASLERAVARFRGDFLDGEPAGDWHLEHRDRLQRLYVDALMELGGHLLIDDRAEKAIDVNRRVLTRDPLHEEAALALMRAHASLGERAQALRVYKRLAELLRTELDAEPGVAMVRLSEQLQHG
jgi:predicted ATPase